MGGPLQANFFFRRVRQLPLTGSIRGNNEQVFGAPAVRGECDMRTIRRNGWVAIAYELWGWRGGLLTRQHDRIWRRRKKGAAKNRQYQTDDNRGHERQPTDSVCLNQ